MRHANISLFVPHVGCRHRCSFCDQNAITGCHALPHAEDVDAAVLAAGNISADTQIAFFGGSFTAIERGYMTELLRAAYKYVRAGRVSGIRVSTRPDAIDGDILDILASYGVTAVELGAQSMDDSVLAANRRGHTSADVVRASGLISAAGMELGLQMMTGLYTSDDEKDADTARALCRLAPATVRIYPTIVFKNTYLNELFEKDIYRPQTLDGAVMLCNRLINIFEEQGIRVIRTGLHTIEEDKYTAGPWHPAFRELCDNAAFFDAACAAIRAGGYTPGSYTVYVAPGCVSKMTGQCRSNILKLKNMGYDCRIAESDRLSGRDVKLVYIK